MVYKYDRDLTEDEKFQTQQIKALTEAFESANKKNKNSRGIYGVASKKEISDLKEEGINTNIIPWLEDKEN